MQQDCISYGDCRLPCMSCNAFCKFYNKTCMDCAHREHEECGLDGHEVYEDSMPCKSFAENEN